MAMDTRVDGRVLLQSFHNNNSRVCRCTSTMNVVNWRNGSFIMRVTTGVVVVISICLVMNWKPTTPSGLLPRCVEILQQLMYSTEGDEWAN